MKSREVCSASIVIATTGSNVISRVLSHTGALARRRVRKNGYPTTFTGLLRALGLCALAMLLVPVGAGAAQDEFVIKNAGITRTISAVGGPLRTTKLEANGVQVIRQPGVEFIIDIDYKGEPISLTPADFEVRGVDEIKIGAELCTTIRLQCVREEIPLVMSLRYHRDPVAAFQQKSIEIEPCKKPPGAILRRIILDDQVLKPEYVPVVPVPREVASGGETAGTSSARRFVFGAPSSFAVIDRIGGRGMFFFVTSVVGKEGAGRTGSARMWEEIYVPLDQGYQTGRATIGAVNGPPEILFKRFREFLWQNYCAARKKPLPKDARRVEWTREDVLAGKIPDRSDGNSPRVLVLRGDDWAVGSPGKDEASFAAISACIDVCRNVRESGNGDFIELNCGTAPGPNGYGSEVATKLCPGSARMHWLSVVDCVGLGVQPGWHTLAGRQARYDQGFVVPPAAFGAHFDFGLKPDGSNGLPDELAPYLAVYQHILDFPDGSKVDGEGHIIGNKGFIIFFNPTSEAQKVLLPLDEPELELKGTLKLKDLTQPASPGDMGSARAGEKVEIEIPASTARVIGINL
ncbi:MAG: hypothetical protein ACP5R5_02950 [Armatimonadota bacterium]